MMKHQLVLLCLLASCGVKNKVDSQSGVLPTATPELPNVSVSQEKSFYLHLDKLEFQNEKTVVREYRIVQSDLSPITQGIEFSYAMPEMPEMPVEKVVVEQPSPGFYRVKYFISMPGLWEFRVSWVPTNAKKDSITFRYQVAE